MTFRDDHDAALARADALARENEELRRKNEELEEKAKATAEADAPRRALEELARKRRPEPPEPPRRAREPVREPTEEERRVTETFCASYNAWLVSGMIAAFIGVPAVGIVIMPDTWMPWSAILAAPIGFGLAVAIITIGNPLAEARERRWLAELPIPFDARAYLDYLGGKHPVKTVVEIHLELAGPISKEMRELLPAAAEGSMRKLRASWEADVLVLKSPGLWARFPTGKYSTHRTRPGNVDLHRWVRRAVARAVMPIARAHELSSVRVA